MFHYGDHIPVNKIVGRQLNRQASKLDVIFSSVVIPMVCTYSNDLFETHID